MKILVLSRYSRLGASSRLRTMQYLETPEFVNIEYQVDELFDDQYLNDLYSNKTKRAGGIGYLVKRIRKLVSGYSTDVIWLEYEALPWVPWLIEKALLPRNVPIISDFDDAIFHRYDQHKNPVVRAALGKKIANVMRASEVVLVGNSYLAEYARKFTTSRVEVIPTVVDLESYKVQRKQDLQTVPVIGWVGTPQTWLELAHPVHDTLRPILSQYGAQFQAIGADLEEKVLGSLKLVPWSEVNENALISALDIGVMPLHDSPWTRGKCGYKLIQYMACGIPVIASPVGVNSQIVDHGKNGYLAQSNEEWQAAAAKLLSDPKLRKRMGQAGRKKVEESYSLQAWSPKVAHLFSDVLDWRRSP